MTELTLLLTIYVLAFLAGWWLHDALTSEDE